MAKTQTVYICTNCDAQFPKWNGRCLECGAWGSLQKQEQSPHTPKKATEAAPAETVDLASTRESQFSRVPTRIGEVDRVLGGGIVAGSLLLLSGEPGVGKSTILSQLADSVAQSARQDVIYVSGEESAGQVRNRMQRLGCALDRIKFISEINVEKVGQAAQKHKPALLIVDSIQTVYSSAVASEPGSVSQVRAATLSLLETAKKEDIPVMLVGHITKDGQAAGPKTLEHIVDTVIYLETEKSRDFRILRAPKNRFGSANEVGIFEMTDSGFRQIKNPTAIFVENSGQSMPGSVVSCVMEGTRPFLAEVQALVSKTVFGYPQRRASGFDLNRLQVLSAVLAKRVPLQLVNQDVVLNVVGGMKVNEPALDLAVCLAIASSFFDREIGQDTMILGEVGLGGEVRKIAKLKERLKEAESLGFKRVITPRTEEGSTNLELIQVDNVSQAVKYLGANNQAAQRSG